MAWCRPGDKPLSKPMMVRLPKHICVTRPQWVKYVYSRQTCMSFMVRYNFASLERGNYRTALSNIDASNSETFPYSKHIMHVDGDVPLNLSQCTLAGPVYTGMPLECHWLIQCTLGYHWATQRILAGYTGTPLEKLSWNSPHWNATGKTLTFSVYTGTPLDGLWRPTHAPTHIVKHAE